MDLKATTAKGVGRRVLKKAAEPVRAKAEQLAPKESGDLAAAISISTKARKRKVPPGTVEVYIGVSTDEGQVATQQEFGNEDHAAQPFLRPAWIPLRFQVLNSIGDGLMVETNKSVARARRKAAKP